MDSRSPEREPLGMEDALSHRERQLLGLAAQGFTDNAIARELGISLATVGTYWGRIRIKFGPLNRTELVAVYLREAASRTIQTLRTENERLINDLSEHAKTAQMLRTSLELFKGLIDTAPDAILLVNQDGLIELANEQAEEMFGYESGELLGISVEDLIPMEMRIQHISYREDYNTEPVKRRMGEHLATMAQRKDGTLFRMATALSATPTPNGLLITCIIRDLTPKLSLPDESGAESESAPAG
ncbi:MAG TPA: PAS domain S-box protein [Fimbriimonas sp.]